MGIFKRRAPDPPERGMHLAITNHPRGSTQPLAELVREIFRATTRSTPAFGSCRCRCGPDCPCRKDTP